MILRKFILLVILIYLIICQLYFDLVFANDKIVKVVTVEENGKINHYTGKIKEFGTGHQLLKYENGIEDQFSQEQLSNINYVKYSGTDLFFEIITGGMGINWKEIARLSVNEIMKFEGPEVILENPDREVVETIYSNTILNNTKYIAEIRITRAHGHSPKIGTKNVIELETINILPKTIKLSSVLFSQFDVKIYLEFGNNRLHSPQNQKIHWSKLVIPGYKVSWVLADNLQDEIFSGNVKVKMEIIEKKDIFRENTIGSFIFGPEELFFPPEEPNLSITSKSSTIELNITNHNQYVDHYDLYRDENNIIREPTTYYSQIFGDFYEDDDQSVEAGKRYYYRAVAIGASEDLRSNMSNEVNGMPLTQYRMTANLDQSNIVTNSVNVVTGKVETIENLPADFAEITISIPEVDWTFQPITTNANGDFTFEYRAPAISGNYSLIFTIGEGDYGLVKTYNIQVSDRPETGHDLSLSNLLITSLIHEPEQTMVTDVTVTNNGTVNESGANLEYLLLDDNGNTILSENHLFTLSAGNSTSIGKNLIIPQSTPSGNYVLQVTVRNDIDADELQGDNRIISSIFIDDIPNTPVYRTQLYF